MLRRGSRDEIASAVKQLTDICSGVTIKGGGCSGAWRLSVRQGSSGGSGSSGSSHGGSSHGGSSHGGGGGGGGGGGAGEILGEIRAAGALLALLAALTRYGTTTRRRLPLRDASSPFTPSHLATPFPPPLSHAAA